MIGDKEIAVCADMLAKEAEGDIVTRETRAAEAETASEILAPDASVRADGVADDIHITAWDPLAEIREGIGEGDLHGDVAVERDLRYLRILDAHAAHERLLQADPCGSLLPTRRRSAGRIRRRDRSRD